ncbi:early nodulin-like protein 18 [Curcuma longa]|uniref:early nodulin-like protein 18 n=1 Tax=Curcuma longa TaxID=136217 RepID=UPI003D9E70E2
MAMGVPSSVAAAAAATAITAISLALTFPSLFATSNADSPPAPPYANHTVGGAVGWFFDSAFNSSAVNYSTWASSQNFFLGDYLIFNTDSNNTVIQTFNATTYALCDFSDDDGNDTAFYYDGSGGPTANLTVAVPLTSEGANYFFSAADGGVECLRGMRFEITVSHGRGLPPSLNQPPPPPYVDLAPPPPPDIAVTPTTGGGGKAEGQAPLAHALLLVLFAGFVF